MIRAIVSADNLTLYVKEFNTKAFSALVDEVNKQSVKLTNYTIQRHLTGGTTEDRLRVRSEQMRRTTRPLQSRIEGSRISGGVQFGVDYAKVHVGPKGSFFTIKPKGKWLAIPTEAALTPTGQMKYPHARDYPNTFINPKNKQLVMGRLSKNLIVPFFILRRFVKVPRRVDPQEILLAKGPEISQSLVKAIDRGKR